MNKDIAEAKWEQLTGRVQQKWGELTHNEVHEIKGRRDAFVGKLQDKYDMTEADAQMEWDRLMNEQPDMRA